VKTRINLLAKNLLPAQQRLTLPRTLLAWGGLLLLVIAVSLYQNQQLAGLQTQLIQLEQQHQQRQQTSTRFANQIASLAPSTILLNQKQRLQGKVQFHKQLVGQLQQESSSNYSQVMTALADADHRDIWLEVIQYDGHRLAITGGALAPDSVAEWLTSLGQQPLFSGHSFDKIEVSAFEKRHRFQLNTQMELPQPEVTQ